MGNVEIKTKRLVIKSRTLEEMRALHLNEKDAEMKQAYLEMIEEMQRNPDFEEWACDWEISLNNEMISIGGIGFKGIPNENGIVELGYGIAENYRNNGYATEALAGVIEWAFSSPGVKCVQAQTDKDNTISQKVLLNNGFQLVGQGNEGPLFEIKKQYDFQRDMEGPHLKNYSAYWT